MTLRFLAAVILSLLVLGISEARAHEIRPAYLQISERAPQRYDVLWKVPTRDGMIQNIRPAFDAGFTLAQLPGQTIADGYVLFRYHLSGQTALPGTHLRIDHLDQTTIDTLVNIHLLDGTHQSFLLRPADSMKMIAAAPSTREIVSNYTRLGIEHILAGVDHLSFVAALMLIVRGWPMLLKTVTAFTVAHSITLALATFGYVSLPPAPVEALIALSILLVATEAINLRRGQTSLAIRWPWAIAFTFGLLHGFGFGGALKSIGLPQGDIPLALLFFNIGVELGQLLFIGVLMSGVAVIRRLAALPQFSPVAAAYAIGAVATFWVVERLGVIFA